jgi:hypothetical protein
VDWRGNLSLLWHQLLVRNSLAVIVFYGGMRMCRVSDESRIHIFVAVGIGSWAFHMTLLYTMQLMDELPMVFGNTVLIYQLSEIRKSAKRPINWTLIFVCAGYFFLFTILYLLLKKPVIHQVCIKCMGKFQCPRVLSQYFLVF